MKPDPQPDPQRVQRRFVARAQLRVDGAVDLAIVRLSAVAAIHRCRTCRDRARRFLGAIERAARVAVLRSGEVPDSRFVYEIYIAAAAETVLKAVLHGEFTREY